MMYQKTIDELKNLFSSTNHERGCNKQQKFNQLLLELNQFYTKFEYRFLLDLALETIPDDEDIDRAKEKQKTTKRVSKYVRRAIKSGYLIKEHLCNGVSYFRVLKGEITELLIPLRNIKEILEVSGLISKPEYYNYLGNPKAMAMFGFRCMF